MARIAGIDLPREKRVEIGLTYIYGIGRATANTILAATGVNPDTRVRDLTEDEVGKLRDYIDKNLNVEGDRHRRGLPVRGQSTKQNARTRKGPKKTVSGRKK